MDFSKLKPFDLEAAKAGKPFTCDGLPGRIFIGVSSKGDIVYENLEGNVTCMHPSAFRMLPEVKKKKAYLAQAKYSGVVYVWNSKPDEKWHTIIKEFEIEYED